MCNMYSLRTVSNARDLLRFLILNNNNLRYQNELKKYCK